MSAGKTNPIEWTLLLPKLDGGLFDSTFTTQDLSASIISFMVVVAAMAMVYVTFRGAATLSSVRFIRSLLEGTTPDTLAQNRRNLLAKARQRPAEGALWNEFNETLVESYDGSAIYNTVDAAYFFNTHTLARGVTESRLLSALPGILTALGVFGTFVGLQLGIGALDFSGNSSALQESIPRLIAGAAVAFSTSVWGVGTSMLFNFFEKMIEQVLRARIYELQRRIDSLFERTSAEQTLIRIQHHNAESEDLLKGLGEQIGDQMQKAVADIAEGVQGGIQEAIGPAIEKLVHAAGELSSRQASGSERALEGLLSKFSGSIEKMGGEQREAFEKTAAEVRDALGAWGASMGNLTHQLESKLESWSSIEDQRESSFKDQMALLTHYQKSTAEKVEDIFKRNAESAEQVLAQTRSVNEQSRAASASIDTLSQRLAEVASRIEASAQNLNGFSNAIATATDTLGSAQTDAARSIEHAIQESASLTQAVGGFSKNLDQARAGFENVANELRRSAELANTSFSTLESSQAAFLESLASRMSELGERINDMLVEYSERVRGQTEERLNAWNEQTHQFSSTMVDAVSSMQDILNEVEDVLAQIDGRRRAS